MNDWSLLFNCSSSLIGLLYHSLCVKSDFFFCVCKVDWTNVEERLRFLRHFILRFRFSTLSCFHFSQRIFLFTVGKKVKKSLFLFCFILLFGASLSSNGCFILFLFRKNMQKKKQWHCSCSNFPKMRPFLNSFQYSCYWRFKKKNIHKKEKAL